MSQKVLCENCLEEANYIVVDEDQLTHIKGILFVTKVNEHTVNLQPNGLCKWCIGV